jgi:hypothetical protein
VPNVQQAQKSFWALPIELLGDMCNVVAHFVPFRDIVSISAKVGAQFAPNVPQSPKSFWMHPMVLLGDMAQVDAQFGPFGDSANLDAR